ncbi:MAG: NAD(P)H-dependent oxidoreductase subunit E [Spirochaetia bacterium]|nr:NAD(P)H-dependent oxidoreductase subunit E [Spirochaetia bacterium]
MNELYDSVIATYKGKPGALLSVLEEVQRKTEHTYLNEQSLLYIAQHMGVPLSQVYSVVTFYSFFNLKPQGEHTITVCRGTACHTRGSKPLLNDVMAMLNLEESESGEDESYFTTPDPSAVNAVKDGLTAALDNALTLSGANYESNLVLLSGDSVLAGLTL